jgi:hypothetical protein
VDDQRDDREARLRRVAKAIEGAGLRNLVEEMAPLDYLLSTRSATVRQGLSEGGYAWRVYRDLKRLCKEIAVAVHRENEDIDALADWLSSHATELIRAVLGGWSPHERRDHG